MSERTQPDPALELNAPEPVTLRHGDATLDIFVVPWDTAIFGFPVAQVARLDAGAGRSTAALFAALEVWIADERVGLVCCRLDHLALRDSMALEAHGFRFVETVYEPTLRRLDAELAPTAGISVADATVDDLPGIQAIARTAFTTGRYLLDWRLPAALSHARYVTWVRNAFDSEQQVVLKAEVDGDLAAFFIVERQPGDRVHWHLTAVAPSWQGRGIGRSVWRAMIHRAAVEGATSISTTVSGHNLPVLNLYARLGFSFASSQMTFHRLVAIDG